MQTIFGIGFMFPSDENQFFKIDSKGSLSDADIAIFDSSFHDTSYHTDYSNSSYQGKTLYNQSSSFRIREHFQHWQSEISHLLNAGKTVIIILSEKNDFFIHTGRKETSGTGRNQKVTNIVEPFDNYRFLPIIDLKIHHSEGSKIFPTSNVTKGLDTCLLDYLKHEAHIQCNLDIASVLFTTRNNDKILGLNLKIKNGNLVFFPAIVYPDVFYESKKKWSQEALNWGKRFNAALIEFSRSLNSEAGKTPVPDWASNPVFQLKDTIVKEQYIAEYSNEIFAIQKKINDLKESISDSEQLKDLLFETGKSLENAVIRALKILGYQAENYNDGNLELDQIIISPEGDRYIGECEGKDNKDIDISKFRQLQDNLNEDFSREEVQEKALGILFGNPQRLIDPAKRTLDFTEKCKKGAEREKVALVKTTDLFQVTKYIIESEDENFRVACRQAIRDQLGKIVDFPKIQS